MTRRPVAAQAAAGARPGRVEAAGCLVHRRSGGRLQVLLVHRPAKRDRGPDWSWPKGKLAAGEPAAVGAVRETVEETGLRVRLGVRLGSLRYPLADGRRKRVRYWAATVVDGATEAADPREVDDLAWLDLDEAARRLTHPQDCEPLAALRAHLVAAPRGTWPLVVLRHGKALPRAGWAAPDFRRPLAPAGVAQAEALREVLACWAPERVVTSPWLRCAQSVRPFAVAAGVAVETAEAVSEAGHERDPRGAAALVGALLGGGAAAVVCSHRPVLPALLEALAVRADPEVAGRLRRAALSPGEMVVAQVAGVGGAARVTAIEHHSA
ncbi:NUDIX hydrolase [Kineococcus sp. NUM-3379]